MKLPILPLVALSLLLGACNTTRTGAQRHSPPPVLTGTKATAWGELPTYDPTGHKFTGMRAPVRAVTGTISLDLKVGFDGRIEDIAVFESSGNTDVDRVLVDQFKKARYSLKLRPEDPAPYVVRITMHIEPGPRPPAGDRTVTSVKSMPPPTKTWEDRPLPLSNRKSPVSLPRASARFPEPEIT